MLLHARKGDRSRKTKYDIGDTVLITAKICRIEQIPNGEVFYYMSGKSDLPFPEDSIAARIEPPWTLAKQPRDEAEGRHLKCGS